MFFSLRSCKYKILSWYCFMVGLGEISIFDILILKNEHQTAINQARRFTWRRILRFASFTQFYRHQPRITTIYRDFTVIFMVWTRSLIFIVDLDGFQINVLIDEFLANQNMAMVVTVNQRPRFKGNWFRNESYQYEYVRVALACFAVKMFYCNNCMYTVVHLNNFNITLVKV